MLTGSCTRDERWERDGGQAHWPSIERFSVGISASARGRSRGLHVAWRCRVVLPRRRHHPPSCREHTTSGPDTPTTWLRSACWPADALPRSPGHWPPSTDDDQHESARRTQCRWRRGTTSLAPRYMLYTFCQSTTIPALRRTTAITIKLSAREFTRRIQNAGSAWPERGPHARESGCRTKSDHDKLTQVVCVSLEQVWAPDASNRAARTRLLS